MDYRTDNNPKGINFIVKRLGDGAPGYITEKQAGEDTAPTKFALEPSQEYPYSTPRETWMSYAYLKTASTNLAKGTRDFIDRRLKLAAANFGIDDDLVEIDALVDQFHKEASEGERIRKYALTVERGEDTYRMYPVNSKTEVRNSIAHLNNANALPIEWMKQACVTVVDRAVELGVPREEIPEKITRLGVRREPDFEKAAMVARGRARFVKDPETAGLYTELVKSAASDDEEQLDQYIDLWIDLDRAEGIHSYGRDIGDPYSAFYSGPETAYVDKVASDNAYLMKTLIPTEAFLNTKQYVHEKFSKRAAQNIIDLIDTHGNDGVALSRELDKLPLETQRNLAHLVIARG